MKRASVVLLTRKNRTEFLWVKRPFDHPFLGGYWALVGGGVDDSDRDANIDTDLACAARELLEEMQFDIDPDRLTRFGSWSTPEMFSIRYESVFFVADLSDHELTDPKSVIDDEAIDAEWISVERALKTIDDATRVVSPPIRVLIDLLNHDPTRLKLSREVHDANVRAYEVCEAVHAFPLRTKTLPPAETTNVVLVGHEDFLLVDPGTDDSSEIDRLTTFVEARRKLGGSPMAVVLTHHHPDHVLGAAIVAKRYDIPIWGHPDCEPLSNVAVDRTLEDGETLVVGKDQVVVHYTPGHSSDHIVLELLKPHVVIGGDLIASFGTILVTPPDGHMASYLASLKKVSALGSNVLVPAHGWVVPEPHHRLDYYFQHRTAREKKILAALITHPNSVASDLVPIAYADTPKKAWPLAELSVQAHLIHLVEQNLASETDRRYTAI